MFSKQTAAVTQGMFLAQKDPIQHHKKD